MIMIKTTITNVVIFEKSIINKSFLNAISWRRRNKGWKIPDMYFYKASENDYNTNRQQKLQKEQQQQSNNNKKTMNM